jgi:galactoside O-acetyltransferase
MNTSFYTQEELADLGLGSYGDHVLISRKASIYSTGEVFLGSHVRIDDFCIISGKIRMGSYIHISAYVALYGRFGIEIGDYATLSGRVMVYSQNDDYSGEYLTNPMVPESITHVSGGKVTLSRHSIIGAGSIILPGITIGEGVAVGAMSLVKESLEPWYVYAGVPAKKVKERSRELLKKL